MVKGYYRVGLKKASLLLKSTEKYYFKTMKLYYFSFWIW